MLKHGIEVIVRPVERVTDTVNANRVLAVSHCRRRTISSGLVRTGHAGLLFLLIEPQAQRCTYGTIARCFLAPGGFHPVEVAVKTFEEVIGEAQTDDTRAFMFLTWHRALFPLTAVGGASGQAL